MTQKWYRIMASTLHNAHPTVEPDETEESLSYVGRFNQWHRDIGVIADVLGMENGRFKRDLFLNWCQFGGE